MAYIHMAYIYVQNIIDVPSIMRLTLFGRIGRIATEEVAALLTKCVPMDLEPCSAQ